MKKQRGFTLIELLVVIAIIGILTTLITSNLTQAQTRARDARRKTDLRVIAQGLEMYYSQNAQYPFASATGAGSSTPFLFTSPSLLESGQVYIKTIPKDPRNTSGFEYFYCVQRNATATRNIGFNLFAKLESTTDPDRFCGSGATSWSTSCILSTSPTPTCGVGSNSTSGSLSNLTTGASPLANYVVSDP